MALFFQTLYCGCARGVGRPARRMARETRATSREVQEKEEKGCTLQENEIARMSGVSIARMEVWRRWQVQEAVVLRKTVEEKPGRCGGEEVGGRRGRKGQAAGGQGADNSDHPRAKERWDPQPREKLGNSNLDTSQWDSPQAGSQRIKTAYVFLALRCPRRRCFSGLQRLDVWLAGAAGTGAPGRDCPGGHFRPHH